MHGWERHGDHLVIELTAQEAGLIRRLVTEVDTLLRQRAEEAPADELAALTGIRTGPSTPPTNPLLARLLPDFHRPGADDDREQADLVGALRSLHEPELIDRKTGAIELLLRTCPDEGGEIHLTEDEAGSWLAAVNDVRLMMGTVLGITDDHDVERIDPTDPRIGLFGAYEWFTVMQDSLLDAMAAPPGPGFCS